MSYYNEPTIYDPVDPLRDGKSHLELVQYMGSDQMVVHAARVSYNRDRQVTPDKEEDRKLIKYMIDHRHTSPFEHCVMTFLVKCPLMIRSQWMRHRTWSYNEVSRRYTSEDLEFFIPESGGWREQDEKNKQMGSGTIVDPAITGLVVAGVEKSLEAYQRLLNRGVAREQARMVLPQNMYARFYATVNLHNMMHFYRLRADKDHAQEEIVVYAEAIEGIVKKLFPISWGYFKERLSGD